MAKIVGYFCGYPVVLKDHLKAAALSVLGAGRLWPLPDISFRSWLADDLGNRCCASLALIDRRRKVVGVSLDEWHGLNAMERDDQL